jgi:hypothetical protein
MNKSEILDRLAPCGIDCGRCVMYAQGPIAQSARTMKQGLVGFEKMAERMQARVPALAEYAAFARVLETFTQASCTGCRQGGASLPFCTARTCFKEMQVDFCFECKEFPCQRNQYPEMFEKRWRDYGERMKQVGVEQFHEEQLKKPRYE